MKNKTVSGIISTIIIVALICFLSESFIFVFCRLKGLNSSRSELISYREGTIRGLESGEASGLNRKAVHVEDSWEIHPFFGYNYNSKLNGVNNFGFHTKYNFNISDKKYSLVNMEGKDILKVGIFGGSFADTIGSDSDFLERKLAAIFPDKIPVVINFGVAGHALPQPLFIFISEILLMLLCLWMV